MLNIRRREILLAVCLSGVAGFVDAIGFVHLGGYFLSFMSGNTTRMSAGGATTHWVAAGKAAGLIGMFVLGVMVGAVVSRHPKERVAVLVATSATLGIGSVVSRWTDIGGLLIAAAAMGVMNSVFQRSGEVSVGLTYMTGTLVKAGQRFVDALFGGPRWAWLRYAALWVGLAAGAVTGAMTYHAIGLIALWIAVAALLLISAATATVRTLSESNASVA
ncbi:YoaK family protein [Smaragdicoccus niigatensis]